MRIKKLNATKIICLIIALFVILNGVSIAIAKTDSIDKKAKKIAAKSSQLKPSVTKLAIQTFYNSEQLGVSIKKPIITVIDYSLPSTEKRLWVIDVEKDKVLYSSLVAHGKNSGENHTTKFSNKTGSFQSSIGVFITENTYFGRHGYSLKLEGLEKGFNDKAKPRTIVMHSAPYVSEKWVKNAGRIGRSWGCPAIEEHLTKPIIDSIKNGTLVFSFYPNKTWLSQSKFINYQA